MVQQWCIILLLKLLYTGITMWNVFLKDHTTIYTHIFQKLWFILFPLKVNGNHRKSSQPSNKKTEKKKKPQSRMLSLKHFTDHKFE